MSPRGVIHKREFVENLEIFAKCYSQTLINPLAVDFYSPRSRPWISSTVESKITHQQPVGVGGEICLIS